ncbi:ParA family protein [Actinoplanes sp. CA-054009]
MLIAMCSAKGSPGVTTAGLAFCLSWARRSILAECDPSGGDVLAGFLQGRIKADRGLEKLAVADLRDRLAADFWNQLIDLDAPRGQRLLLPGLTDPARSSTLVYVWDRLAAHLSGLEAADPAYDVLADCGRLGTVNGPMPLIQRADLVLLVARSTLPSLSAAAVAAAGLRDELAEHGTGADALALLVIADGAYRPGEITSGIAEAFPELTLPVAAVLPEDANTANALNRHGEWPRRSRLQHAAAAAEKNIWELAAARQRRYRPRVSSQPPTGGVHHAR